MYLEDIPHSRLTDSNWFDRGWTLQELIAPRAVAFFDRDWRNAGTKIQYIANLSRRNRIPESVLRCTTEPSACSVAQRMSWAADRICTRIEDKAYSLLGLFDIHMPLIYGEGESAFLRLQNQIIQISKDESIFAWKTDFPGYTKPYSGLFAPSPSAYIDCNQILETQGSQGFSIMNGELSIWLKTFPHTMETFFAKLNCTDRASPDSNVFILISKTCNQDQFVRVRDEKNVSQESISVLDQSRFKEKRIRVLINALVPPLNNAYGFWLRTLQPPGHAQCGTRILSNAPTHEVDHVFQHDYSREWAGVVHFHPLNSCGNSEISKIRWIKFGFDEDFNPSFWLANDKHSGRLHSLFEQAALSGSKSPMHKKIMANDEIDKGNYEYIRRGTTVDWRRLLSGRGAFFVTVDKNERFPEYIIDSLNLIISVKLQHHCSQTLPSASDISASGPTADAMGTWVVDITDKGGESLEQRERRMAKERN